MKVHVAVILHAEVGIVAVGIGATCDAGIADARNQLPADLDIDSAVSTGEYEVQWFEREVA